jgi:UDP-2,3-diacylglucosamine pyrophosphatase LpxH
MEHLPSPTADCVHGQADMPARDAKRVFVISDLHLGGDPAMMSRPQWLGEFIDSLPARLKVDESLELIINGDFVDFLAIAPFADFTSDPIEAVKKLSIVTNAPSSFAVVFDALARHVTAHHQLVIIVGNHDLELALPAVQDALCERLLAPTGTLRFIDDGRAYRIGNVLIEHGNTYDGANDNDWNGVRHLASVQTRARMPHTDVQTSAGSKIVHKIVNELKPRYPFLPTIQPEGQLLVLLMLEFEPELRSDIAKIAQLFRGQKLAEKLPKKGKTAIAATGSGEAELDEELRELFASNYTLLHSAKQPISSGSDWLNSWRNNQKDGLAYMLKHGLPIPTERLNRIRLGMKKIVDADQSDLIHGDAQQYGVEAERMLKMIPGLQVVVMGHTHLPRIRHYGDAVYINTGTWIDRFRIPPEVLNDATCQALIPFLRQLLQPNGVKAMLPHFADLSVAPNGHVRSKSLYVYEGAQA